MRGTRVASEQGDTTGQVRSFGRDHVISLQSPTIISEMRVNWNFDEEGDRRRATAGRREGVTNALSPRIAGSSIRCGNVP